VHPFIKGITMKSPASIAKQIAKLQAQAKAISRKRHTVVSAILKQMEKSDVSLAELRAAMGKGGKPAKAGKRAKAAPAEGGKTRKKAAIKYRDSSGNTWTGRGRAPRWMMEAEKNGHKREEFAV
jgi:DNA-binding protein H-NS